MKEAAQDGKADRFNEYVDYQRVRESLKGQFAAKLAESATQGKGDGAALMGAALVSGLINAMIENLVRPEMMQKLFAEGKAARNKADGKDGQQGKNEFTFDRVSSDKVVATAGESGEPARSWSSRGAVSRRGK